MPDLDAINAALMLGDVFYPPVGSVCRFLCDRPDSGIHCVMIVDGMDGWYDAYSAVVTGTVISRLDRCDSWLVRVGERSTWNLAYLKEVREVPSSAPSFSEWERP